MNDKHSSEAAGAWSDHFDLTIKSESTRAKVVLSACYLDELLRQLISIILKPCTSSDDPLLDGPQAPLGSFSSKIEIAFRIGAIAEGVRQSLHLVRKIRNQFAHQIVTCDFSDKKIADWNLALHNLNDHASAERRARYSVGAVGDFEKSISWLIYWLKSVIEGVPSKCPQCGSEMEHRAKLKALLPGHEGDE